MFPTSTGRRAGGAPRVALTTDWLNSFGGAERVLVELQSLFPGAPIHTTVHDPSGLPPECQDWDVRPSFLQRLPFARRRHRPFLPLMPFAFEAMDLSAYDLVLTTSSAFAKGVILPPHVRNVCYCYTPPRYLWDQYHEQTRGVRGRALVAVAAHWLRLWDRVASERVDRFIAISRTVAERIRRYYGRESTLVYPPVDVERFTPNGREPEPFDLIVARLVPYKRIDLAVEAATRLGRSLVIVGDGPERRRLERMAGSSVRFLGRRDDAEVAGLYARCRSFIFPGMDDFGIAPVEAQAAGRPVVAFGRGGACETVVDGETGALFHEPSVDALVAALERCDAERFDPAACRLNAERFDAATFRSAIARVVAEELGRGREGAGAPRPVDAPAAHGGGRPAGMGAAAALALSETRRADRRPSREGMRE